MVCSQNYKFAVVRVILQEVLVKLTSPMHNLLCHYMVLIAFISNLIILEWFSKTHYYSSFPKKKIFAFYPVRVLNIYRYNRAINFLGQVSYSGPGIVSITDNIALTQGEKKNILIIL